MFSVAAYFNLLRKKRPNIPLPQTEPIKKKEISFESIQEQLLKAIGNLPSKTQEELTLVEGFVYLNLFDKIDLIAEEFSNIKRYVPMVMCVGKETGLVYYFPVKVLIPGFGE